ncbi:MAG TPA: FmdE family protein [Malonomonas sp.]
MADKELYQRLAERHGHFCPMSTLGVRLGEEALRRFAQLPMDSLQLSYLMKTCAADGIRIVFESAAFPAALSVEPAGQHRLRCRFAADQELSLQLSAEAMRLAAGYRELDEADQPERLDLLRTVAADRLIDFIEGPIG